jgi:hypothetical protein
MEIFLEYIALISLVGFVISLISTIVLRYKNKIDSWFYPALFAIICQISASILILFFN